MFRLRVPVCFAFIMSSHLTINSSQSLIDKSSASVAAPVPQSTDVGGSTASAQAGPSSGISLPPEIVALITQSVQASMVAEWAKTSSLPATSITSLLADQPFVVGPGISVVPLKLVFQIMVGKYIDLCDLLPMNMQVKEPELQFLIHDCLVLTSHIAVWTKVFAVFSFILVSHFPDHWRDL